MSDFRIIGLFFCLLLLSCESNAPRVHTDITGVWRCEETNNSTVSQTSYLLDVYRKASDTTQYVITNFFQAGDSEFIVVKLNKWQAYTRRAKYYRNECKIAERNGD